jgi:two-component system OmpR family sensor kinase
MSFVRRLPIRVRLTLAFSVAMAVVLAAMGFFLHVRLGSALDRQLDQGLRTRTDDLVALVRQAESGLSGAGGSPLTEEGESFAQVLGPGGTLVDATPGLSVGPLLTPAEADSAGRGPVILNRDAVSFLDEPVRLLATPVEADGRQLVVVVGASLEDRIDALEGLRDQLLIGGPIALLLASLAGYLVAAAALRPVDEMRRRAEEISGSTSGQRLPVPSSHDEISRLGETLNDMLTRLESALVRERRFVADASHELRTPLALMKTELELALRRTRSAQELEGAVRSAAEETDRLVRLAEDLLVLAQADQGELPLRPERVPAEVLLAAVARLFGARAAGEGREIVVASSSGLALVGDRLRLEQAVGNLVENALRHGAGPIELRAVAGDAAVELHVLDGGPGFPDAFRGRAFERFTRADEARSPGGVGLGLAIVDVIARAHGGSAHAAGRPAGGADVWLALPAAGP